MLGIGLVKQTRQSGGTEMIPKKAKLFLIEWIDSYHNVSEDRWQLIRYLDKPMNLICYSVGWLLKENDQAITVAPHISDVHSKDTKGGCSGYVVIPKVSIVKRTELKYNQEEGE